MRRYLEALYGNELSRSTLGRCVEQGTLPHALILEGGAGSGKKTLAKELASALLCEKKDDPNFPLPCHSCRACRLIAEEKATDVHFISRGEKATLGVDAVREMRSDVYLSATEFNKKIYIFKDAHTMTPQAQNALLVVLEEPPKDVNILLLAENADDLLTTVRSRARLIRMQRHAGEALLDFLKNHAPSLYASYKDNDEALRAAIVSADGRIGEMLSLLQPKSIEAQKKERQTTLSIIRALANGRYSSLCDAFSALPTKREELSETLARLSLAIRDLILLKKSEEASLCFFLDAKEAEAHISTFRTDRLFQIYDILQEATEKLGRNANTATVLSVLKADLRSV